MVQRRALNRRAFYLIGFIFGVLFIRIGYIYETSRIYRYAVEILRVGVMAFSIPIIVRSNVSVKRLSTYVLLLAFDSILVLRTMSNDGSWLYAAYFAVSLFYVPVFFDSLPAEERYDFLRGLACYFRIIIVCEFACMILFRETGMYNTGEYPRNFYLLGHVNASIKTTLPAVTLFAVLDIHYKNRLSYSTVAFTIATIAFYIFVQAAASTIGAILYVIMLCVFLRKNKFTRRIPKSLPLFLSLAVFVAVCFLQVSKVMTAVNAIALVVGRDPTLSGRTTIWSQAMKAVRSNLNGYGLITNFSPWLRITNIFNPKSYIPSSAHNIYFDILMQAGVLGLILFILYVFRCIKSSDKAECLVPARAFLFAYLIMWNFEPYFSEDVIFGGWIILALLLVTGGERKRSHRYDKCDYSDLQQGENLAESGR